MTSALQIHPHSEPSPLDALSSLEQISRGIMPTPEMLGLLRRYRLLPQLLRELVIDEAIAPFTCTFEETAEVCKQFYAQHKIANDSDRETWLQQNQLTAADLDHLLTRNLRLEKYQQATWGNKVESHFLRRKQQLDQVVYSLLRVQNAQLAQELYFRIQDGEQTFAEVVAEFSQGPEVKTNGLIGPATLGTPHPAIAQRLVKMQPGDLSLPFQVEQWAVVVRLEKLIAAEFDEAMRQRLLTELFEQWIQEQVNLVTGQAAAPGQAVTTDQAATTGQAATL